MPQKKKSSLSQYTKRAKRMRQVRSQETNEDREHRLAYNREQTAESRASESSFNNETRLATDRERHALSRASETLTNYSQRLKVDRERHIESRALETFTEHSERLTADRERHAESRASETFTQYSDRLTADRERHAEFRASETFTECSERLTADRERHAESRASETFTQYSERLTADRERHAESRASETFTQYSERLTADRERHVESRASETFTECSERLTADRESHAESRASETLTQYSERLTADRERHARSRASESFTQYEARLAADRESRSVSRTHETQQEHDLRLELARGYYENSLQHRNELLSLQRERVQAIRSNETESERAIRLQADRIRTFINRSPTFTPPSMDRENYTDLPWVDKENSGFTYTFNIDYSEFAEIGRMIRTCSHCQSLKWYKESNGFCCSAGKVQLEIFQEPPEPLKSLLNGDHPHSKQFLDNIRSYNGAFQMTSFGAKQVVHGTFMPTFKVQGQVYHLIGSLLPETEPKFLQIYFVSDYHEQANIRRQNFPNLNANVISELQGMLHQVNPYVSNFKAVLESIPQDEYNNYKFVISADKRPLVQHSGRYNSPSTNEVAVVLVDQQCDKRDIIVRTRDDRLQRISETHRSYDSLQYPLIYCRGEDGYNFTVYQVDPATGAPRLDRKVSALQFYCYLMQIRQRRFVYLQRFRGLFNQFIVDMYAKVETERLVFIRTHQRQLRAENYVDLHDAVQGDTHIENLGRLVILPSSFIGSPRNMNERVQDSFCYVRKYGRPDLFITITTNPKWIEISQELLEGQASYDRHDLISRVFYLKLKLLINLLTKQNVFGATSCYTYNVEWQKRGLPHAHILLWLLQKIRPNDVDNIISAELPNPTNDPILHQIVKTQMIHGPCGALNNNSPCMKDGQCTKKYPRPLLRETITGEDGYPKYRRRAPQYGGFTTKLRMFGQDVEVDNRWVVPYSPVLSRTFQTHINVEMCNSVESIKYIFKYVNKGTDQATLAMSNDRFDEITRFQSGRYISSSEAAWRIFSFPISERNPPVMHLDVHVEGGQRVYFHPDNIVEQLENPRQTTLLAFFRLCESDDFARTLLYDEVPAYYTYDKQHRIFNRRRRGIPVEGFPNLFKEHVLGRVYTVHPNNSECFYVRLLLHTVRGPTSFLALKMFNNTQYPSFQAACRARGLLDDDQHWDNTLAEASVSDSPRRLRNLFAVLLVFCGLSDANQLWVKHQKSLAEDYINFEHGELNQEMLNDVLNRCLCDIQNTVFSIGGNPLIRYGLPEPILNVEQTNREYATESNYDSEELAQILQVGVPIMTPEQRIIFDRICNSALNTSGEMFFLDAPGGTGKTFLTKLILAQIRSQGKIALAVASSGIAATLLPGGKTAHSMFKIPTQLDVTETPVCDISRNSDIARVLRECTLIVWDECTMAHRKAVEAVNRTLQDIRHNNELMGGVTMLFCGDFRQTLPIVTRGTRADEISACLKNSILWPHITRLNLTTNMRAQRGENTNAQDFSQLLLSIGEGRFPEVDGRIDLINNLCKTVLNIEELIISVYEDLAGIVNQGNSWLCERAILTPRNDQAVSINMTILERIEGENVTYTSINRVVDREEVTAYPVEFLNALTASGLPAHEIKLKVGIPIILLRNLSPPKLCNGTRLKVVALQRHVVEAEILTGCGAGEKVFIPRIPIIPNNFPFRFKRVQLPVSVCFAMTINKAQGQTLSRVGVDLTNSCFSHGQLYVAMSRISDPTNLFILAPQNKTVNVVYEEVLC